VGMSKLTRAACGFRVAREGARSTLFTNYKPAARRRSSACEVSSQVNPASLRPKWP
jgi:hypothetical protein